MLAIKVHPCSYVADLMVLSAHKCTCNTPIMNCGKTTKRNSQTSIVYFSLQRIKKKLTFLVNSQCNINDFCPVSIIVSQSIPNKIKLEIGNKVGVEYAGILYKL